MKNFLILLATLSAGAHAEFNNLWVSQYDNLIVELGDNKYDTKVHII